MTAAERKKAKAQNTPKSPQSPAKQNADATRNEKRRAAKEKTEQQMFEYVVAKPVLPTEEAPEQGDAQSANDLEDSKWLRKQKQLQWQLEHGGPKKKKTEKKKVKKSLADAASGAMENFEKKQEIAQTSSGPGNSCFIKCKLCEQAICDDDDGSKFQVCKQHLRDLNRRRDKLKKWAMDHPCAGMNELHALSLPEAKEWHKTFSQDVKKVSLLIDFLLEKGVEPDEISDKDESPLDQAWALWSIVTRLSLKEELEKLKEDARASGDLEDKELLVEASKKGWLEKTASIHLSESIGLLNVIKVLACHWYHGRGDVAPDLEEKLTQLLRIMKEEKLDDFYEVTGLEPPSSDEEDEEGPEECEASEDADSEPNSKSRRVDSFF